MVTFPYYAKTWQTSGREGRFPQATTPIDITLRECVAALLLLDDRGGTSEAAANTYEREIHARNVVTEPITGPDIIAYTIARRMTELANRGADWDVGVTYWIDQLDSIHGAASFYEYTFPGTNQYVTVPSVTLGETKSIKFTHELAAGNTATNCVLSGAASDDFIRLKPGDGNFEIKIGGSFRADAGLVADGEPHAVEIQLTTDSYIVIQDGIEVVNIATGANFGADFQVEAIAKRVGGTVNYFTGPLYDVTLCEDGELVERWEMHDGPGLSTIRSTTGTRTGTQVNMVDPNWLTVIITNYITTSSGDFLTDLSGNNLVHT